MRNENLNRIEKDLAVWTSKENKNKLLYPNYTGQEKYVLKDRLKHMIEVRDKYKSQPLTKEERKTLNTLKKKTKELENQLYPTLIEKVLARIGRAFDKVRDRLRYGPQSNTQASGVNQEQRSLTNRQKLKNAIAEKLTSVKEKLLPTSQRERKNDLIQSNHFSVNKDTFKQKAGSLSIDSTEKPKHRLRIK